MAYTEVTVSGYNASPPPDDGTQVAANEVTWAGIKTKIGDPIKTAFDTCQTNISSVVSTEIEVNLWAPAGTPMLFQSTTPPTNWTKSVTHNDKALRVVSGAASSGGNWAFSSLFQDADAGFIDGHALTVGELPSHSHSISWSGTTSGESATHTHSGTTGSMNSNTSHSHTYNANQNEGPFANGGGQTVASDSTTSSSTSSTNIDHTHNFSTGGQSVGHTHTYSGSGTSGSTGSGTAHSHFFFGAVQYVDLIIATKDA